MSEVDTEPSVPRIDLSEDLLTPTDVERLGRAIGSETYWQADVGRAVGYSKSTMTRFLNGSRATTTLLAHGFRRVIIQKLEQFATLIAVRGMPNAREPETREAQALIKQAVALLRTLDERRD